MPGLERGRQKGLWKKLSQNVTMPRAEQELLVGNRPTSDKKPEKDFFGLVKSEAINGFTTSKEAVVELLIIANWRQAIITAVST